MFVEQAVVDGPGVDADRVQRTDVDGALQALDDCGDDAVPVPAEMARRVAPRGVRDPVDHLGGDLLGAEVDPADPDRCGAAVDGGDDGHQRRKAAATPESTGM